jgi:hypothetical protein
MCSPCAGHYEQMGMGCLSSSGILILCVVWRGIPNTVTAPLHSTDNCSPMDCLFGLLGEETDVYTQSCVFEKVAVHK